MKKWTAPIAAFLLTASLLLTNVSTALAIPIPPPVEKQDPWTDPVVTPVSGDQDFNVTYKDPAKLKGTESLESGLIVPAGFAGEMQFGGKAVILHGLSYGSARACFPFPNYLDGWRGDVYQWMSGKWVKQSTAITLGKESTPTTACVPVTSDGTYALIIGFNQKLAKPTFPLCKDHHIYGFSTIWDPETGRITFNEATIYPALPIGTKVRYEFLDLYPAGYWVGDLKGPGTVVSINPDPGLEYMNIYETAIIQPDAGYFMMLANPASELWFPIGIRLRIYTEDCYMQHGVE